MEPVKQIIEIEVAYALPERQAVLKLNVPPGTTAQEAVANSGIRRLFPEIMPAGNMLGIFGKSVDPETLLRDKDRVEIYRPLETDPKEARRKRALATKGGKHNTRTSASDDKPE